MDEATASVDHVTDTHIQQMVKRDFKGNCTVITIAHRLHTVAFYDRILLLGGGKVQELDTPLRLLTTSNSSFRKLAEESGDYESLLQAAKEAEE
jgi:ABC-type multidrug transport system fused ATPase/permease subunit